MKDSNLIVAFSDAPTGGRQVVKNLAKLSGVRLYFLRDANKKFYDYKWLNVLIGVFGLFLILWKLRFKVNIVLEGLLPSYLVLIFYFIPGIRTTTRIGRIYTYLDFIKFVVPHLLSDTIISPSAVAADQFKNNLPRVLCRTVKLVHNPVLTANIKDTVQEKNNILIVGRLVPAKRIPVSIKLAQRIQKLDPALQIVCVGDGNKRSKQELSNLQSIGKMKYIEYVADISSIMNETRLLINCGINEGFSMVSFEAASFGVPTLSLSGQSAQNEYIEKNIIPGYILESSHAEIPIWLYNGKHNFLPLDTAVFNENITKNYFQ